LATISSLSMRYFSDPFSLYTLCAGSWLCADHTGMYWQVPLSVAIVWAYSFFLTAGGAYNFKGCSSNIPSSNILLDSCRRHLETMRRCRTDVSSAWRTAAWVRIPYPFQWGPPTFHFKTGIIMIIVSLVASVDSVSSPYLQNSHSSATVQKKKTLRCLMASMH
jgi:xanthine/uracil permease